MSIVKIVDITLVIKDINMSERELMPVIHACSKEQAFDNIEICIEAKIDTCWLIGHTIDNRELISIAYKAKQKYKNINIGINCLGMTYNDVSIFASFLDYVWTDNCYAEPRDLEFKRNHKYFGGIAFKYQNPRFSLEDDCINALEFVDVITTSGNATGKPPTLDKIKKIHSYVNNTPIAIASGIDENNIQQFLPYVEYYLVATSISKTWDELDFDKILKLNSIITHFNYENGWYI